MSIFENMGNAVGNWLAGYIAPKINDNMGRTQSILATYYTGDHRPQIKRKEGTTQDDNVIINDVGLAVDRSVSRLFRGGVKFNLPDGADAQEEYLEAVWDLNKQEIILYQVGLHGAVYGTGYFKIAPDGLTDPYTGKVMPRLIPLDPEIVRVTTDPQDMNIVAQYRIEYKIIEKTGEYASREVAYREITRRDGSGWVVEHYEQAGSNAQWKLVESVPWEYDFPPIIHWKNLPSLKSCYGDSDIDDAINVQDKMNFVVSNTGKIIKHHASPRPVGTGFSGKDMKPLDDSPDSMIVIPAENAKVFNLQMDSDLVSSRGFADDLKQSIFDVSREIDLSSIKDKLGALTNFGLRVLYTDALDKNDTKRSLYGDALKELNRRLLVLAGYTSEASNPGEVQWGEAMIINVMEEMQTDQLALDMGLVDKGTVYARYQSRYGKSWEDIQQAIADERAHANQNNADIGSIILRNFSNGGGQEQTPNQPPMMGQGQQQPRRAQQEMTGNNA
jgi:hypothetical protein